MFETERCLIHPIIKSDFTDVKELYMNHDVRKYLGGIRQENSIREIFGDMLQANGDSYYWVIREKLTNDFIGLVSLDPHHDGVDVELSYQFSPKRWGKGFATEVLRRIISIGFKELKLTKIVAETQSANLASCKLLERVGMKKERTLHRFGAEQTIYYIQQSHTSP